MVKESGAQEEVAPGETLVWAPSDGHHPLGSGTVMTELCKRRGYPQKGAEAMEVIPSEDEKEEEGGRGEDVVKRKKPQRGPEK